MHHALYIASVLGAVALFMMMPRRGHTPRTIGALLGAMTLGGLWLTLGRQLSGVDAASGPPMVYYYIFSAIAIAAAARVITHTKPVYSALWFIMVVLASAGLFLTLEAEFMAVAMVIIYGGAILVTYVFVIMLASHSGDPDRSDEAPDYDRIAREPAAAIAAGFLLLAVLLSIAFEPLKPNPAARSPSDAALLGGGDDGEAAVLSGRPSQRLLDQLPEHESTRLAGSAMNPMRVSNAERVGLDLFESHPLGLELAGVILLVSLIGAVVIARRRVEEATEG